MTAPKRVGAIDAGMSIMGPETASRWPDSFWHIFRKYGVEDRFRRGFTFDEVLAEMDRAGVPVGVISSFKFLDTWAVDNDEVASFLAHAPERFVGCCTFDIRDAMPTSRACWAGRSWAPGPTPSPTRVQT